MNTVVKGKEQTLISPGMGATSHAFPPLSINDVGHSSQHSPINATKMPLPKLWFGEAECPVFGRMSRS